MKNNHDLEPARQRLVVLEMIGRWENTKYQHEVSYRVQRVLKNEVGMKGAEEGIANAIQALDLLDKELKKIEAKIEKEGQSAKE